MPTILIIDDNDAVRTALDVLLSLQGHRVIAASTPADGLRAVAGGVDLVIQDMNFRKEATSGEEGIALFHALRMQQPSLAIILLTAWTSLETAVELVKAGAAGQTPSGASPSFGSARAARTGDPSLARQRA